MTPRRLFPLILAALVAPAMAQQSAADKWPPQTIKIIVPYSAGGGTDVAARLIARKLQDAVKKPVIVDNRPGGKSIIAYEATLHDPADGSTFLFNNSSHGIQVTYKKAPYDVVKDFTPVTPIAHSSVVLAVAPNSPAKTLAEFVAYVRSNPGKVSFGSFGAGTSSHLYGEILNVSAKIDMLHVAYKGSAPALADLMGGHLQALFVDGIAAKPLAESGKIRLLAITGSQRWKSYPDLPTFGELGYAELGAPGWWGLLASSKVPAPIVARLADEVKKIVAMPDVVAQLRELGAEAYAESPADFQRTVQSDMARWKKIVQERNLELD